MPRKRKPEKPPFERKIDWSVVLNGMVGGTRPASFEAMWAAAKTLGYEFFVHADKLVYVAEDHEPEVVGGDPPSILDVGPGVVQRVKAGLVLAQKHKTAWVISEINWNYDDEYYSTSEDAGFARQAYVSQERAQAVLAEREAREIANMDNPFRLYDDGRDDYEWDDVFSMPYPVWRDYLLEAGIEPPDIDVDDPNETFFDWGLDSWWMANRGQESYDPNKRESFFIGGWTDEQALRVARTINLSLYTLEEVPIE